MKSKGCEKMEKLNAKEIMASSVTIEVKDALTGEVVRHVLPIDYRENSNCLRLIAENYKGEPSELFFYTTSGLGNIKDICGQGANIDPCGGHSPE
jgi:hypothetical protein